ncbi:MAG: ATP-binding protein [Deltaproteobacteria bacterium]|nr:ATP-binding protein [Deltaproteobacteria bacterium]
MNAPLNTSDRHCPFSKELCHGICIYANILENISLGLIAFDTKEKTVVFQNKTAIDMFETITPKNYKALSAILFPEGMEDIHIENTSSQKTLRYEGRLLGYSVYTVSNRYLWIFISDITEKARLEVIAEAANMMNNIGYIFFGIRHEIGNPLNSLKMALSVLHKNINQYSSENILKFLDRALNEISRIEYLLKSLKSFNMFERLHICNIDLPSFMEKFLPLVKNDFEKKNIKIKTIFSPDVKYARVDPRILQQVMLNIMINAYDALNDSKRPEIVITMKRKGGLIWINIMDNGCGMTWEQQGNLFRPFYTSKPQGTGLGLTLTKKMLAQMNGNIAISSVKNKGATVKISIPEGRDNSSSKENPA